MTNADDEKPQIERRLTDEDRRIRESLHELRKVDQRQEGDIIRLSAAIERLEKSAPDASRIKFSSSVVFTIVLSALTVAGLLWKVSAGVDSLALRMEMNYTIMKERTDQLEKALNEETRQRQLQAFELKESIKKGKP